MNDAIRKLEDNVIAVINDSTVPMEAKRLILKDVLYMVTDQANAEILMERQKQKEAQDAEST